MTESISTRGRPRSFNREAALAQMTELFWRQGYDATSVAALSEALGLKTPSLYAAFGNKEEAYFEAIDYYSRTDGAHIWNAMERQSSAQKAVETMLQTSAKDFTRPDKPRGCMITLSALTTAKTNTAIIKRMKTYRTEARRKLETKIEQGIQQSELPATANAQDIARFYHVVQQGMAVHARDGASLQDLLQTAHIALLSWASLCTVHP